MTVSEAQVNPDTMIGTMIIFGTLVRVLFDSGLNRSFISTSFALHVDQELSPLKHKLVVMTPLREQILRNFVFISCKILIESVVLKANLILLEMHDFDVILGMDWLSTNRASMDCFTKKVVFQKPRFPELEFVDDCRILPTCVILALKVRRLLHKGCKAYLAHVVDTSTPELTLKSVSIVREFSDVFLEDLLVFTGSKIEIWY